MSAMRWTESRVINTTLQGGDRSRCRLLNRFNGLLKGVETVELMRDRPAITPLKRDLEFGHFRKGIPKGFRPKAQGCEERATLGIAGTAAQPQRGCGLNPKRTVHS